MSAWVLQTVKRRLGGRTCPYEVQAEPLPHIVVQSKKDFTFWPASATECTPRLLVNHYNGCTHRCFFCYSRALPGHFAFFEQDGCVAVFEGLERNIERRLRRLNTLYPVQLSPATDPFQPVNERYELTERIIDVVTRQNVPVDVLTKGRYSDEAIHLMARHPYSIGQVTILTPHESLRRKLMMSGATTEQLFENLNRLRCAGIYTILRLDPIIPGISDNLDDLCAVIQQAAAAGAQHVIVSAMRIPYRMRQQVFLRLMELGATKEALQSLYTDRYDSSLHPKWAYRKPLFDELKAEARRQGLTFALCREFVHEAGRLRGLNQDYCTADNCEGRAFPKAFVQVGLSGLG